MGKFGKVFEAAQSTPAVNLEIQKSGIGNEKLVNLGVKIPESWRRHYTGQAKLRGITISAVILEALNNEFGKPE